VTINKRPKKMVSEAEIANAKQDVLRAQEFMMLGECEGVCQVGSASKDRRSHCRRLDTVLVMVYVGDGTREGVLTSIGRVCMKHLPSIISLVKKESPGGNGEHFKTP